MANVWEGRRETGGGLVKVKEWTRREFLGSSLVAALALGSCARVDSQVKLVRTDPGCPPDAFAEILAEMRRLNANQKPIDPKERLRKGREWFQGKALPPRDGEQARWQTVEGSGVKVRVLVPAGQPKGVLLALHGGGWVLGTALSDEKRNWLMARELGLVVVSPDYRLAPEHPFPAAPDDCEATARWLLTEKPFGDVGLSLVGASAGAHLAALTLQRLEPQLRGRCRSAVLFYGVYDLGRSEVWRTSTRADFPDLAPEDMNRYLEYFIPGKTDEQRRAARYSPLAGDLQGMPPALFLVGTADLLADDTRRLAELWAERGNRAELLEYAGAPHGFDGYGVDCGLDPHDYALSFLRQTL